MLTRRNLLLSGLGLFLGSFVGSCMSTSKASERKLNKIFRLDKDVMKQCRMSDLRPGDYFTVEGNQGAWVADEPPRMTNGVWVVIAHSTDLTVSEAAQLKRLNFMPWVLKNLGTGV